MANLYCFDICTFQLFASSILLLRVSCSATYNYYGIQFLHTSTAKPRIAIMPSNASVNEKKKATTPLSLRASSIKEVSRFQLLRVDRIYDKGNKWVYSVRLFASA